MNRRAFLKSAALAALGFALPGRALGFGDTSKFIPAMARHGGRWNTRARALRSLCWELASRTSIEVFPEARPLSLGAPELFEFPFLYFGGEGPFPPLGEAELANLRRYLTFGGFMLADANDGSQGTGFDASLRRELARLFPDRPLRRLPDDHVLFKSYYLLDRQAGRLAVRPFIEALLSPGGRAQVVYSQNDLAGAFSRDETGDFEFEVSPGGESQRELAFRVGINLAMYSMCLDYKKDSVHLPFIMKRRK